MNLQRLILIVCLTATACLADEFRLKDAKGREYGPFEMRPGARLQLGDQAFELTRVTTPREAVIQALRRTIIPSIDFQEARLQDALAFLTQAGRDGDPEKQGVNLFLLQGVDKTNRGGGIAAATNITLSARNISLYSAIKIVGQVTQLKVCVDEAGVRFMAPDEPESEILYRTFRTEPVVCCGMSASGTNDAQKADGDADLQRSFAAMGIGWPKGSSIHYDAGRGLVVVANTAFNLHRFEQLLNTFQCVSKQVEVEVQFVQFDKTALARLPVGCVDDKALIGLWTNGYGHVLAAPRVVTRSGAEASIRGVREIIYPTDFGRSATGSNDTDRADESLALPGDFATRETGAILTVLPEVAPDGNQIMLTFTPSFVEPPVWRDYGHDVAAGARHTRHVPMEQPVFSVYTYSTQLTVADGTTMLAGGGVPMTDGNGSVYCFVTARLLTINGDRVKNEADSEPQNPCEF